MLKSLCVFCGSYSGIREEYRLAGEELGRELARRNVHVVYGGGNVGMMGIVADAVLQEGGGITGVIPESLMQREVAHRGVEDMRVVISMHTRKALMSELSEGFVALPGGLGTFEELFEVLTWAQLGFHHKPIALLNVSGYFDPLIAMMDRSLEEGFMKPANYDLLKVTESVPQLLDLLLQD